MKYWALQDAKARLSQLVRAAEKEPQIITLRGEEAVVVVSTAEFQRLQRKGKAVKKSMTLLEALRACPYELEIPPRTKDRERDIGL
jgi:antitoxin Phd